MIPASVTEDTCFMKDTSSTKDTGVNADEVPEVNNSMEVSATGARDLKNPQVPAGFA